MPCCRLQSICIRRLGRRRGILCSQVFTGPCACTLFWELAAPCVTKMHAAALPRHLHGSHRFFQLPEPKQSTSQPQQSQQTPSLHPVELRITNLARASERHQAYDSFEPALASAYPSTPEASAALSSLAEASNKQVQQVRMQRSSFRAPLHS